MEFIKNWQGQKLFDRPRCALSLGVFDGLHLGHRHIVNSLIESATALKALSLLLTFEPHPLEVLAKAAAPPLLTTVEQKAEILADWGLDRLGVLRFDRQLASLEPLEFLDQLIGKFVEPAAVILGPDFRFGQGAKGGFEEIRLYLAAKFPRSQLSVVSPQSNEEGLYASSRIRQDLKNGLVESAGRALGRPYRLSGLVEQGQARGRLLGFPTANLGQIRQLIPGPGVYATWALVEGERYGAMTSIGYNPTFGERPMTVETHIFEFQRSLYGQRLAIDFKACLRPMRRFKNTSELVEQLKADRQKALKTLALD